MHIRAGSDALHTSDGKTVPGTPWVDRMHGSVGLGDAWLAWARAKAAAGVSCAYPLMVVSDSERLRTEMALALGGAANTPACCWQPQRVERNQVVHDSLLAGADAQVLLDLFTVGTARLQAFTAGHFWLLARYFLHFSPPGGVVACPGTQCLSTVSAAVESGRGLHCT